MRNVKNCIRECYMEQLDLTVVTISLLVVATGLIERKLELSVFSEPMLAVGLGIVLGPEMLGVLNLYTWGNMEEILETACRFTMGMALMATALRLPKNFLTSNWQSQSILVIGAMLGMWLCATLAFYFVFNISFVLALLLGAIVTPTDPVVASTMVSGTAAQRYLPPYLRNSISFESGINDGLALPFVMLPMLLLSRPSKAWEEWLLQGIFWETIIAIILGMALGWGAGKLLHLAHKHELTTNKSILSFSVAFSFVILGGLSLIHTNSIIGIFVAGLMINKEISRNEDLQEEKVQEMMERIFVIPIFVLFGLVLPWQEWEKLGLGVLSIIILIHLFRRLPVLLALKPLLKDFKKTADVLVMGWFGPIGVTAIYYSVYVIHEADIREAWPYVSLIVFSSVVLHGLSAYPISFWYSCSTGYKGKEDKKTDDEKHQLEAS